MFTSKVRAAVLLLVAPIAFFGLAAPAGASLALTPYVDCVQYDAQSNVWTAYFGYDNASTIPYHLDVGDFNNVYPGSEDAGQPTDFARGNYPRVFSVTFDNVYITSVHWDLNAIDVAATAASPACTAGTTVPASDVTANAATLNGVVDPDGLDTMYHFEYGTSPSLGQSTDPADAGAGTRPALVQASLSGLAPSTRYYFRLDTTNAFSTSTGDIATFTTAPK